MKFIKPLYDKWKSKIDQVNFDTLRLSLIKQKLAKLKDLTKVLVGADETLQTYHAKRMANTMTDLFLAVHAMTRIENNRDKQIAKIFIDHLYDDHPLDQEMLPHKYFEEIIGEHTLVQN